MAGIPGRSGGPRTNAGGAREGAGRKPRATKKSANKSANETAVEVKLEPQPRGGALKRSKSKPVPMEDQDMLTLLQNVALGRVEASTIQVRAAIAAVQYTHTKKGDGGKKEEKQEAAKAAGKGKFATKAAPKLVVNNK